MCSAVSPQSAAIGLSIDRKAAYPNPKVFRTTMIWAQMPSYSSNRIATKWCAPHRRQLGPAEMPHLPGIGASAVLRRFCQLSIPTSVGPLPWSPLRLLPALLRAPHRGDSLDDEVLD